MYSVKYKEQIGEYLGKKISDAGFDSQRKFCEKYVELKREYENGAAVDLNNLCTRVSLIIRGERNISITDLPYFCEILDITCEELLSAGEYKVARAGKPTNYSVGYSHNVKDWISYLNNNNNILLSSDEFGMTFVDYAYEANNYELIKFLVDKGYICFDGGEKKNYVTNFDAGTSFKASDKNFLNSICANDEYRMKTIILAVNKNDLETVSRLKARELPSMYYRADHRAMLVPEDFENTYNEELINAISKSEEEILKYFTSEFTIKDAINKEKTFMYPHISQLLDALIVENGNYAEEALKKAVEHSRYTYNLISQKAKSEVEFYTKRYIEFYQKQTERYEIEAKIGIDVTEAKERNRQDIERTARDLWSRLFYFFKFNKSGNVLAFKCVSSDDKFGIVTNIAHVSVSSKKEKISSLINELNELYDKIKNFKDDKEKELKEWFVKTAEKN